MNHVTESELIARCRAGDEDAFRALVDLYKDLVFAVITRMVPDPTQAEDLAQEVFLRVHRGLPYYRGEARLVTWIYRIVVNLCLQGRGRRQPLVASLDEPDHQGRPRLDPGTPDRAFGDLELRDRLEKAIERLPAQDRLLISAHYLEGMRYDDLAGALGVPLGTIKTHLHRAKRRLRELLQNELR